MKRTLLFSVVVLVAALFVGSALKAHAATTPASPAVSAVQSADNPPDSAPEAGGYWAAWANAVAQ
jgi:hypothetical protein